MISLLFSIFYSTIINTGYHLIKCFSWDHLGRTVKSISRFFLKYGMLLKINRKILLKNTLNRSRPRMESWGKPYYNLIPINNRILYRSYLKSIAWIVLHLHMYFNVSKYILLLICTFVVQNSGRNWQKKHI